LAADALSADNDGHYNKFSVAYTHQQNLTDRSALYLSISGQLASKNLDTSEKIGLGGVNAVRAYPEGEAYGDEGYVLTLETRTMMPALSASIPGQVELIGFIDHGAVTLNDSPWESGNNHRALSSAGIGFQWVANNKFIVEAYLAHKLGNAVAESAPDKMNRFWIQGVMYF
jgi:hemolysin activation/secretion protein